MTMTTCSVNLTNCDLAPRLSLCPDSGLLVAIILGVPFVDNWNIPIIIIIIIIILLIIMIIAVFLTVRSINLKVISRWGKIISRWGKIISRWGKIIQKLSQGGVKLSKKTLKLGSNHPKIISMGQFISKSSIYLKFISRWDQGKVLQQPCSALLLRELPLAGFLSNYL